MRRTVINLPYQNTLYRSIQVPLNQLEQLKKTNAIQKYDLIWISEVEDPYLNILNYLCPKTNTLKIPSTLALVTEVYYDDIDCIWVLLVNDRILFNDHNPTQLCHTVCVHISDVVANYTQELRRIRAASIIQKYYRRYYFTRKMMAKRIQRKYIQHYWNPMNPNMKKRLEKDFQDFCIEIPSCHVP